MEKLAGLRTLIGVMTDNIFDPDKLLRGLNWAESDDLEFKSAKGGLAKSLWETYSAMANAHITNLLQSLVVRKMLSKEGHGRWSWCHLPEITKIDDFANSVHNRYQSVHNDKVLRLETGFLIISGYICRKSRCLPSKISD